MRAILLLMVACLPSCFTFARSYKGDLYLSSSDNGIVYNGGTNDTGGITGLPLGAVASVEQTRNAEAKTPPLINIGGLDGITVFGVVSHSQGVKETGRAINRALRNVGAVKVGEKLIDGAVEVVDIAND